MKLIEMKTSSISFKVTIVSYKSNLIPIFGEFFTFQCINLPGYRTDLDKTYKTSIT